MPLQEGFEAYHSPAAKVIESMAARQGAYFLDFTELKDFSEHRYYFSDETHLNQKGVEAFNGILLDSLYALNILSQNAIP
jgi:lysophospholipase L1-like esterase